MREKYVLATDLDGTLVGSPAAVEQLFQYVNKQESDLNLVYITGRHIKSALQLLTEEKLPLPDVLVCDVGSTIYCLSDGDEFIEDEVWMRKINVNWSPQAVVKVAEKLGMKLQAGIPHAKRVSFYATSEQEVKDFFQELIQEGIAHKGIYSSGVDVDILPENSGKGEALTYVLKNHFNSAQSVLVAGNSGNDLEMLCLGYPSVIVGNAEKELQQVNNIPSIYKASAHYAEGIKEGWEYFFEG